jgi:outer membrane lipopolysaccharide assembly protein LptE/RlpB
MANPWRSGQELSRDIAAEMRTEISRQIVNRIGCLIHLHSTTPRTENELRKKIRNAQREMRKQGEMAGK